MDYRTLGRSGLRVSRLTLGTMTFGGRGQFRDVGQTDLEGARRQIDIALDAGVNLIDTADVYSSGAAEEILGQALNGRRRDRVLLASKVRFSMGDRPNDAGLSRHHLIEACEASLRRLKADHIDLYQLHEWDGETPLEETMAALDHLVQSGKVRYVGCSNFGGWQVMKALAAARSTGLTLVSQQVYLSLQERSAEYEIVPSALDQGLGLLIWSPLAGGLLSGKYRRGEPAPPGSRRAGEWAEPPVYDEDKLYDTVDVLLEIAQGHGVSPARVALAWLLGRPGITTVIVGARTDEQLADNLAAADLELSGEEIGRLEEVSRPPLIYPYWHQRNSAADRLSAADLSLIGPQVAV